jgi:hypothetical protein
MDKTDPDIIMTDGRSVLAMVRCSIGEGEARLPHNPNSEIMLFQVKEQWEEVEQLLVERGALDSG